MDKITYEGSNPKIEQFQLIIYTIYSLNMAVSAISRQRGEWLFLIVFLMLGASWIVSASRYKTYEFRAKFISVMTQLSLILFGVYADNIMDVLPVFMLFVVLLGLYGLKELIMYSVVSILIIFGYHRFVADTIPWDTAYEIFSSILYLSNVFFLQFVTYVWTKRNSEGSRQLRQVISELAAIEQSKDDILANMSHELRTPLNTICGMSEIILEEELPYKVKENVMDIQMAGRNLMSVVSDIVDYSELQSGRIELGEETYSIASTLNDIINMTMARKKEKHIELVIDCDAGMPNVLLGDEKKLRRIIMKLVDNAIKFTDEGCVSIKAGYRRESYGINLIVVIRDTGIGMDESELEKMFTTFGQADTGRNRQSDGIGLGFAISNALIRKMGGAIMVKSKPGRGTTVQIAVPQKVVDESPMVSIQNPEKLNVATYIDMEQFSLVEIRDEYSRMMQHMVEQLKIKCHTCRNFPQLQRTVRKEELTHIVTSALEYRSHQAEFDELALKTKVIVVMEPSDEKDIANTRLYKVYKPFHVLSIASIINAAEEDGISYDRFTAPDAHALVVDDNLMNIRVIEGLLANYKIKVTAAVSGQEALEKITTADYDLIFMDHMMPQMDGVETLHKIRYTVGTYFQKVPVIALTANAVAGTREMFLAEGFQDFLEKPVERSVLERVLKRHLPKAKLIYHSETKEEQKAEREEQTAEREVQTTSGQLERELEACGMDVRKGLLYCNGMEGYLGILAGYCEESDKLGAEAQKFFEQEDWKNYVITVHGIKGAMRSIGATDVSERAYRLESAGREERWDYIRDNHAELMEAYQKLFENLRKNPSILSAKSVPAKVEETDAAEEQNLTQESFAAMLQNMEKAMYDLDEERLMGIVLELQKYRYCDNSLREVLAPVKKKVEMSDYVSAVELTMRLKEEMESR